MKLFLVLISILSIGCATHTKTVIDIEYVTVLVPQKCDVEMPKEPVDTGDPVENMNVLSKYIISLRETLKIYIGEE